MPGDFPLAVGENAIPEGAAVYAAGAARESLENAGVRFPPYQALLIGQSYAGMGEEDELSGCIEDAETTAEILSESDMVRYGQGRIATLYDATRNEILAGIAALAEGADEQTVSVFYYSGHGGEGGYLIGYNRRTHRQEWLNPAILARAFASVPGRKIILIDACFSGALISRGAEAVPERFAEAFLSAFREPAARSGELQAEDTHVLVAATGEEYSQSINLSEAWFGVFTAYLQEGLCGAREDLRHMTWYEWFPEDRSEALLAGSRLPADADGDRMVTVDEAYRYVRSGTFRFIRTWNRVYGERLGTIGQTVSVWPEDSDAVLFGR